MSRLVPEPHSLTTKHRSAASSMSSTRSIRRSRTVADVRAASRSRGARSSSQAMMCTATSRWRTESKARQNLPPLLSVSRSVSRYRSTSTSPGPVCSGIDALTSWLLAPMLGGASARNAADEGVEDVHDLGYPHCPGEKDEQAEVEPSEEQQADARHDVRDVVAVTRQNSAHRPGDRGCGASGEEHPDQEPQQSRCLEAAEAASEDHV